MGYENWKIKKEELQDNLEEYSKVAQWCNENQEYQIGEKEGFICTIKKENPSPLSYEEVRRMRIAYRKDHIDDKTAERSRKTANGTWTEEDEQAYLALDAEVTAWIEKNLPYPVEN